MSTMITYSFFLFVFFLTGIYLASFGVLIPYYSSTSGHDQTYYSFIFISRSIAYITGTVAIKYLSKKFQTSSIFVGQFIIISVSLFLCSISVSALNLTVMIFLSGACIMASNVIGFSITGKIFHNNDPNYWIVILELAFGCGAALAPLLVMFFQLHVYKILAILTALIIPLAIKYPIPHVEQQHDNKSIKKYISSKTQIYLCLVMFLFPAQEAGFGSWIPTYSIKSGIAVEKHVGVYGICFWFPNAISRLVWIFLVKASVASKIRFIYVTLTITALACVLLQWLEFYTIICVVGSIIFGSMLSCIVAFCVSLPLDNGFSCTTSNNANFILANCIGQGLMNAPLGYAMNIFGFESLIIFVFVSCLASYWSFDKTMVSMEFDKQSHQRNEVLMSDFN